MNFICLDCHNVGPLNQHGYCARCGSSSVAISEALRQPTKPKADVEWLRREIEGAYKK